MNENAVVQRKEPMSPVAQVKELLSQDAYRKKFQEVLGKKAPQFMASIVNLVTSNNQLKKCNPQSIMAAAFVAASFDLPIDSNLGFAALVPYEKNVRDANGNWSQEKNAQFQMMYKGYIQLAIRTGEYEKMNCSEVYADELVSYNPITGECKFVDDFSQCSQRLNGEYENVCGYYAWFQLRSGFKKELFMTKNEVNNHARKYSQAYRYDLNKNKQGSKWSTDFDAMAKKTVIKMLLSKWGILSIDMQKAIVEDQKVYNENGIGEYADNTKDEVEAIDPFDEVEVEEPAQIEDFDITS